MLVTFLALVWAPPSFGLIVGQPRSEAVLVDRDTPFYVADEIARRELSGRIFAPMDWSDYLVWRSNAAVQPLVHSHVHLITAQAWDDYEQLVNVNSGWFGVIERYDLRYLVVRRTSKLGLSKLVWSNPRCRVIYQDQQAIVFEIVPDVKNEEAKTAVQRHAQDVAQAR
jgi:hypothetical protein